MRRRARFASSALFAGWFAGIAYLLVALALRLPVFGDPVVDIDEQYYLLVGDRMRAGALPFVDLWDRKPAGLFALYEAFAATRHGPIATHLAALVCVVITALALRRIALVIAPPAGAWLAGLAYLIYLSAFHCFGGQTPVFYNLAMVAAALVLTGLIVEARPRRLLLSGIGVMLLVGIALQIKYTVVFEGLWFGLTLLALALRRRWPLAHIAGAALLWVFAALLPTLIVIALYWRIGHLGDWIAANISSNFGRGFGWGDWWSGLGKTVIGLAGFALAALLGTFGISRDRPRRDGLPGGLRLFLVGWLGFAIVGYLLVGTYFDHYRAPLLLPLAVLSAPALGLGSVALAPTTAVFAIGLALAIPRVTGNQAERGDGAQIARATALIAPLLRHGCLYVYEGDPALYRLSRSCLVTRYAFPGHLSWAVETRTLGVDPEDEMRRLLAARPAAIVIGDETFEATRDQGTWSVLVPTLAGGYTLSARFRVGRIRYLLYARREAPPV